MTTVLLVIHLLVTIALIVVVLLQRSEGGGLGIGSGGGGMGNFMSGRGTANLLTRATAILGTIFFALSLALALMNQGTRQPRSLLDSPPASTAPAVPAPAPAAPAPAVPTN
ncbi:preprotein translocase subunit SecG [Elioraea rosea]|uniref:preprotein translocase subunit SecG n=1 Tax=Elioraea rosea TaxID=2492390 RepID=UPI001186B056|nr:preprotein translocase subunit SecG [Elioraea rosea]